MTALVVVLALAVGVLGLLVVGLLRSHAEILRQLHELRDVATGASEPSLQTRPGVAVPRGVETAAADITGVTPAGDATKVGIAGQQHLTLLAFLSSGCLTCRGFWEAFGDPSTLGLRRDIRPVIVTKSVEHEQVSLVQKLAPKRVPTVMSTDAWDAYDVPVAPYFLLVDGPSGRVVGEGASASWDQVRKLMEQAFDDDAVLDDLRRRGGASGRRDRDTDAELLAAGITPGHESLHVPAASEGDDATVDEADG